MEEVYNITTMTGDCLAVEEKPAGEVRWFPRSMFQAHDLVLHQRWVIKEYKDGRPHSVRTEWRKVEVGSPDDLH